MRGGCGGGGGGGGGGGEGHSLDEDDLMAFARTRIAGYKTPRKIIAVPVVRRAPNGKADYKWAKSVALDQVAAA